MHYTTTVSFVDIFTRSLALVCVFTATCTVASLWSDCSTFRHTSSRNSPVPSHSSLPRALLRGWVGFPLVAAVDVSVTWGDRVMDVRGYLALA